MLQQTQVRTVIPYWERWMRLFPNLPGLARATEKEVLKAWEGLGYYSRARNLWKASRILCSRNGGEFPRHYEEVLDLPGVGRYTAGAICSLAYGDPTAILDGNVSRVLARVYMVPQPVKEAACRNRLWEISAHLVASASDCSALNQGLMELGATVCLPRAPLCSACPLRRSCGAYQARAVEKFPARNEQITLRDREYVAFLISRRERVLVRQRGEGVVNGGLWEFPNVELHAPGSLAVTLQSVGLELKRLSPIKHTITRNRITLHVFAGTANGESRALSRRFSSEWRPIGDLEALPFSSAHAKLRALVQAAHGLANQGVAA